MIVILLYSALALMEWKFIDKRDKKDHYMFIILFCLFVIWCSLANYVDKWPQPNSIIMMLLGWIDVLLK